MGGKNAPLQPEQSISGVIQVLTEFEHDKNNGKFITDSNGLDFIERKLNFH